MADQPSEPREATQAPVPVVIKKYANRRLYNTDSSSYITLDTLADMIRQGRDFVVYDARSGDDITRGVLTQIIVEEEGKGRNLLPITFLRQLIGFYGDQMQSLVPRYLEHSMTALSEQQQQVRAAMQKTMGTIFPFGNATMEEVGRQNMAIVERAMSLFTPFYRPPAQPSASDAPYAAEDPEVAALREEVARLHRELDEARARPPAKTPTAKSGGGRTDPKP